VQQEIAREIADKLRARLTGEERQRVVRNYTENVEAYQLYLRGRYHWNLRTGASLRQAIEYFQKAIDLDPNYALAYSGLADSYSTLEEYTGAPVREMHPLAKAAASRAVELDDSLAEAHASLGLITRKSWQWEDAEREFKRAIELNPNYASAHQWYALWLEVTGRTDEALAELRLAQQLDPLSPTISTNLARRYVMSGELETAVSECRRIIEVSPTYPGAHAAFGLARLKQGRQEDALEEFQKAVELSGRESLPLAALGYGYAVAGRRAEAVAILKELEDRHGVEGGSAYIAWVYAGLGDKEQAFAAMEKEFQKHAGSLPNAMLFFPYLDTLRDDPRFSDLVRRIGLPPRS